MRDCPYCGAENPDTASFCSLCLAGLGPSRAETAAGPSGTGVSAEAPGSRPPEPAYVSPADFHAAAEEWKNREHERAVGIRAGSTRALARDIPAARTGKRPWAKMISAALKNSLLALLVLVAVSSLISVFVVRSLLSGSETALGIGLGLQFAAEAFILVWGGYRAAAEAAGRGEGWLYGALCVAALVFFWQPLIAFVLDLLVTGRALLPQTFSLVGIMVVVFLFLPLGALGGWLAERRRFA